MLMVWTRLAIPPPSDVQSLQGGRKARAAGLLTRASVRSVETAVGQGKCGLDMSL